MQERKYVSRRCRRSLLAWLIVAGSAIAATSPDGSIQSRMARDPFVDPLDEPALMYRHMSGRPSMSVVRAGRRLIGVGMRGLVVVSDDGGKTWSQVSAPVRSDLLAVNFADESQGWAVGHDGVILHSGDGGRTWMKQLDGRIAAGTLTDYYRKSIASGEASLQPYLDQLTLNFKAGPSLPLLSVCFTDLAHGMAVGPFGMIVATDDAGKSWYPILDRIDNPQYLHLQSIRAIAGNLYIAAEKGTIFRLESTTGRFRAVETGYPGSFFGLVGNESVLLAYGLKGTIYTSRDHGASWQPVKSPLHGTITSAVYIEQKRTFALATAAGELAMFDPAADEIRPRVLVKPMPITGVEVASGEALVLSGLEGTRLAVLR